VGEQALLCRHSGSRSGRSGQGRAELHSHPRKRKQWAGCAWAGRTCGVTKPPGVRLKTVHTGGALQIARTAATAAVTCGQRSTAAECCWCHWKLWRLSQRLCFRQSSLSSLGAACPTWAPHRSCCEEKTAWRSSHAAAQAAGTLSPILPTPVGMRSGLMGTPRCRSEARYQPARQLHATNLAATWYPEG